MVQSRSVFPKSPSTLVIESLPATLGLSRSSFVAVVAKLISSGTLEVNLSSGRTGVYWVLAELLAGALLDELFAAAEEDREAATEEAGSLLDSFTSALEEEPGLVQLASKNGTANVHKRLKVVFILIPFFLQKDRHNLPPTFKGLIFKIDNIVNPKCIRN